MAVTAGVGAGNLGTLFIRLTANSAELVRGMDRAVLSVDKGAARMTKDVTRLAFGVTAALTAVGAAVGTIATRAFMDFESSFAGVRKTVDATEEEFKELSKTVRAMSKDMPVAVSELNRIMELGGQLGVKGADDLSKFTKTIANFRIATGMASDESATAFAKIANNMQEPIRNIDRMGSVVAQLGDAGAATEKEILEMATRISGAGKIAGLTTAEIFSISAAFTSAGIEAEAGGTAIQKVLLELNNAGMRGIKPFVAFMEDLKNSGTDAAKVLKSLGFEETRLQRAFLSVAGAGGLLNDQLKIGNEEWVTNQRLTKEAEERNKTFAAQITITKNRLNDMMISVGEALVPHLRAFNNILQDLTFDHGEFTDVVRHFVNEGVPKVVSAFGTIADAVQLMQKGLKLGQIGFAALAEGAIAAANKSVTAWNAFNKLDTKVENWWRSMVGVAPKTAPQVGQLDVQQEAFRQTREELQKEFEALRKADPFSKQMPRFISDLRTTRGEAKMLVEEMDKLQAASERADFFRGGGAGDAAAGGTVAKLTRQQELLNAFNKMPEVNAAGRAAGLRGPDTFGFGFGNSELQESNRNNSEIVDARANLKLIQEIRDANVLSAQAEKDKLNELEDAYTERLRRFKEAQYEIAVVSAKNMFEDMASMAEAFAGRQSGLFKAMFAASKAFAIAESIIKIQQGIAAASALPFPANLAAIASVVAATSNIVSSIQSVKLEFGGKRAAGGSVQAGKAYLVGERGPEPFIPSSNGKIMSNLSMGSGVKVIVENHGASVDVDDSRFAEERIIRISVNRAKAEMAADVQNGAGPIPKTLERNYGLRRGTR